MLQENTAGALPAIGTLWIGSQLPYIEALCIRTMVAQGHDVTLYAYEDVLAPPGVTVADAARIIPRERVFRYKKTGSYATFADWFRLEMIARTGKTWLDADVALLKPFAPQREYFFTGGEHRSYGQMVNNFVLHLPADSMFCRDALDCFENPRKFLKYMDWHRALRLRMHRVATGSWDLSRFRWGVFGMGLLTELVHRHDLLAHVAVNDSKVVEGSQRILTEKLSDDIVLAHYFTSSLRGRNNENLRGEPGSVHARILQICAA